MMMLTVDEPVGEAIAAKLREVGGMSDLRYVELGGGQDG
jgi:hypothetical protein